MNLTVHFPHLALSLPSFRQENSPFLPQEDKFLGPNSIWKRHVDIGLPTCKWGRVAQSQPARWHRPPTAVSHARPLSGDTVTDKEERKPTDRPWDAASSRMSRSPEKRRTPQGLCSGSGDYSLSKHRGNGISVIVQIRKWTETQRKKVINPWNHSVWAGLTARDAIPPAFCKNSEAS